MNRKEFLILAGGSVAAAFIASCQNNNPQQKPANSEKEFTASPEFYEQHLQKLVIKAQEPPYNLPANAFFITFTDLQRIKEDLEKIAGPMSDKVLERNLKGFIRHAYQKGFETPPKLDKKIFIESVVDEMFEYVLKREIRSSIRNPKVPDYKGAIIAGDDYTRSDGDIICTAFPFDQKELSPDLFRMQYFAKAGNIHEAGHYFMGHDEYLADTYGALKYLQSYPQERGALLLHRDFRAVDNVLRFSPAQTYVNAIEGLDRVIAMDVAQVQGLDDKALQELARKNYTAPAEIDMKSKESVEDLKQRAYKALPILRMQIHLYDAYQQILEGQGRKTDREIQNALNGLRMQHDEIESMRLRWDAKTSDLKTIERMKKANEALKKTDEADGKISPVILAQVLEKIRGSYKAQSVEGKIIANAMLALRNFQDPVAAYGLKPNFTAPVAKVRIDPALQAPEPNVFI